VAGDGVSCGAVHECRLDQRRQQEEAEEDEGDPEQGVGGFVEADGGGEGFAEPDQQRADRDADAGAELVEPTPARRCRRGSRFRRDEVPRAGSVRQ
jgi:hypothetical protein